MRLFGFDVTRRKAAQAMSTVPGSANAFLGAIRESFAGAWQSGVVVEDKATLLTFSAVYACVTMISSDVAKLDLKLIRDTEGGIPEEVESNSPFLPVLRKPNRYQNRIKFIEQWIVSRLLNGNTYVLKQRDDRGIVNGLYILDPAKVTVLVAEDGGVYYRLNIDHLQQVHEQIMIPASEIIHDMSVCLWHPLVGVSPIYACGYSATLGNKISKQSAKFFENMSRPSGILTAPGTISQVLADRLKAEWEKNYSGDKIGRMAVLGDGLEYQQMMIPANDAQLIEQLRWTVEDVARCFHVPLYMLAAGEAPKYSNIEALQQMYYSQTLQSIIESIELCLDEGLGLPKDLEVEFDLDDMLRMDTLSRFEAHERGIKAGFLAPNEARSREGLAPVDGGDTPYMQIQNYSLAALDRRDSTENPQTTGTTDPAAGDAPSDPTSDAPSSEDQVKAFLEYISKELELEVDA